MTREHTTGMANGDGLFKLLWTTGAWRLLLILLMYISGQMLTVPILPDLATNDFASRSAGEALACQDFSLGDAPQACRDAHSQVVWWSTLSGFTQNTIVSVIVTPALGAWSDLHGRKPVILLAQMLACIPYLIILSNIYLGLPLFWLYVVNGVTGAVTSIAPSLAYMADIAPQHLRAPSFGLILSSFSLALFLGPPIGAALPKDIVPLVSLGVVVVCMLATFFLLPESLNSSSAAEASAQSRGHEQADHVGPWKLGFLSATYRSLCILRRNSLFVRLTVVIMISAVVSEGLQDLLLQYLQIKIGFLAKDISVLFMIFGSGALLVQAVLLRPLLSVFGERWLLVLGLFAGALQQATLAFANAKWQALTAVSIGCLGSVTFPTVSSIKANAALHHEQGSVQGALYGARALASGLGPVAFAFLFAAFTRSDSPLPYFPGAPFVLGTVLMAAATFAAVRLLDNVSAACVLDELMVGEGCDELEEELEEEGLVGGKDEF